MTPVRGGEELASSLESYNENELYINAPSLFGIEDLALRAVGKALFLSRAKDLGCEKQLTKIFKQYEDIEKIEKAHMEVKFNRENQQALHAYCELTDKGDVADTIDNYANIMRCDPFYSGIHFNLLAGCAEVHTQSLGLTSIRKWTDADEAESMRYIEQEYKIYNERKHTAALRLLFRTREYNPIVDIIEHTAWDGVERVEHFLTKWTNAPDTDYVHECSRLIFAGGIWRAFSPGCKMDDVVVLIGKQGAGKSTITRWLALNDKYFGEIKTVEGDKATEQFAGKWICEIPELSAFNRIKEVEAVKAFITRQTDSYRRPYDRNVEDRPRRCVFIGTTNNPEFLFDLTGNRRFYPVQTNFDGYALFKQEKECREYILQCWAEALVKFKQNEMPNFAKEELVEQYREAQANATQDDWRIGAIEDFLSKCAVGECVCVKELMEKVISPNPDAPINPTPKDSKDIGIIMHQMDGWERKTYHSEQWGKQRGWEKVKGTYREEDDYLPL